MNEISKLVEVLKHTPKSKNIEDLIKSVERESTVDILRQVNMLTGVWELKWSTSNSPLLNYSPILDNFQILEPERCRGLNLLKPKGVIGNIFSTNIYLKLEIINQKRIDVRFTKFGVVGPKLLDKNIHLLLQIRKLQKGWLDTTILTPNLRVCKGYKGTTFALLKRNDLHIKNFF